MGAIQEVLEARAKGAFTGLGDFLVRVNLGKVNRKVLEALIQAGAFDTLQPNRARLWAGLEEALEKVQNYKRLQADKQMSMFAELPQPAGLRIIVRFDFFEFFWSCHSGNSKFKFTFLI